MRSIAVAPSFSRTGYGLASSGLQRGAGTAGAFFQCAQSQGSFAAERARHAISAGPIEASRDKYQRMFKKSIASPWSASLLPPVSVSPIEAPFIELIGGSLVAGEPFCQLRKGDIEVESCVYL